MHPLVARFDQEDLIPRQIGNDRRRAQTRLLSALARAIEPRPLQSATAADVERFLADRLDQGYHASTLRKERNMLRPFFRWAASAGVMDHDMSASALSARSPAPASSRPAPQPYPRREIARLWATLDRRWPKLAPEEAQRLIDRWQRGVGAYRHIRTHATRLQLDAIVSLSLRCGLRTREIFDCHIDDLHHENAYIVVWGPEGRWSSEVRTVPYSDAARETTRAWLQLRDQLAPTHDSPWVLLRSEATAGGPMKRDTFDGLLGTHIGRGWNLRRLRHTCAVAWLRAGLPAWQVQKMLGLGSLLDVWAYGQLAEQDLEQQVEAIGDHIEDLVGPPVEAAA